MLKKIERLSVRLHRLQRLSAPELLHKLSEKAHRLSYRSSVRTIAYSPIHLIDTPLASFPIAILRARSTDHRILAASLSVWQAETHSNRSM